MILLIGLAIIYTLFSYHITLKALKFNSDRTVWDFAFVIFAPVAFPLILIIGTVIDVIDSWKE